MLRSSPTIAPTKALTSTSSENWRQFVAQPEPAGLARSRLIRRTPRLNARMASESAGFGETVGQRRPRTPLGPGTEHRIPAPLEADRARRFAAEPRTAGRAGEVRRVDLDLVRQGQQLLVEAPVEAARVLPCLSRQVRPADGARRRACRPSSRTRAPDRDASRVTTRETLSGVCPGVCKTRMRVFPSSMSSPSSIGVNGERDVGRRWRQ